MAVVRVCPINGTDPFNEPSKMKSYTRRRKDYSKPLVIDCSVEYELPNSAKPPTGNKNEPLLMIHPSYYRREESKRRSHFVNNLPKKQIVTRFTRSALCRASEKSIMNEGSNDCLVARRKINNNDRKSVVNDVQPLSRIPPVFETRSNFDNIGFQARTTCSKNIQSLQPPTNACTAPEVPRFDYPSIWRKAIQTNSQSQCSTDVHRALDTTSMHVAEHNDLPPVSLSVSPRAIDKWFPKLKTLFMVTDREEDNIDPTYYNRSQDVIMKNHFGNNNDSIISHAQKAKPIKKSMTYSNTSTIGSAANSTYVTANTGATIFQQQPAVGVAAIAATPTPLNCCSNCPTTNSAVDGDRHSLIRQQPWSATTAPEFPSSSLPMSHVAEKRSLNGIICPDVPPQLSSTRKRTSNCNSWHCGECSSEDSSPVKRNRVAENENTEIYYPPNWATSNSSLEPCARNATHRKQYAMEEMFVAPRTGKPHFNSWRGNAYSTNDLSSVKRHRVGTNENTQMYDASNCGTNHSEPCKGCTKLRCSAEPHDLVYNNNYSNNCAPTENAAVTSSNFWSRSGRSGDNLNMLHLFRL